MWIVSEVPENAEGRHPPLQYWLTRRRVFRAALHALKLLSAAALYPQYGEIHGSSFKFSGGDCENWIQIKIALLWMLITPQGNQAKPTFAAAA